MNKIKNYKYQNFDPSWLPQLLQGDIAEVSSTHTTILEPWTLDCACEVFENCKAVQNQQVNGRLPVSVRTESGLKFTIDLIMYILILIKDE